MPGMRALVTRVFNIGNGSGNGISQGRATPSQPEGTVETIGSGGFKSQSRRKRNFEFLVTETGNSSLEDLRPKDSKTGV